MTTRQDFHHSQNPFLGSVLPFPSLCIYLSQYLLKSKGHLHQSIHSLPPPPPLLISPHLTTDYKEDPDQPNIPIVISVFLFPFLFPFFFLFFSFPSLPKIETYNWQGAAISTKATFGTHLLELLDRGYGGWCYFFFTNQYRGGGRCVVMRRKRGEEEMGKRRKREVLPLLHDTPARPRTLSWQH